MTRKRKGMAEVVIYPAWCKGCGICAAFCPQKVIEIGPEGKALALRSQDCVNCGFCELHCPDFAISVRVQGEDDGPRDPEDGQDFGPDERRPDGPGGRHGQP